MQILSQQTQLIYLFIILITQITSVPIKNLSQIKLCNSSQENCTFIQHHSFFSTVTPYSTTSNVSHNRRNVYSKNFKLAAITVAGVVLGLGILRICLMFCNSSHSSNNALSSRHTASVRPQIAIIGQNNFKPDLPPAYTEAIANSPNDENKLPSYDELQNEQHVRSTNEYSSTAM